MICFIQARMNSRRLPGKSLALVEGKPVLSYVVNRLKKSKFIKKIVVLTSTKKLDDKIVQYCKKNGVNFFRGELNNVYKRFTDAINFFKIKSFIRVTADSPNIDPNLADKLIQKFRKNSFDIVTNCKEKTFPKGQSIEVINSNSFLKLKKLKINKKNLEHITSYFYQNEKNFMIYSYKNKKKFRNKNLSIDNRADLLKFKNYLSKNFFSPLDWKKIYKKY